MHHYLITNRLIRRDDQGEFINEDGSESGGEMCDVVFFDSKRFDFERKKYRECLTLFADTMVVPRTETVHIQPAMPYRREDIDTPSYSTNKRARR